MFDVRFCIKKFINFASYNIWLGYYTWYLKYNIHDFDVKIVEDEDEYVFFKCADLIEFFIK